MNWISTKDAKPNDENDNGDFYEDVLIYFCRDCKECSHLTLYEIGMGYITCDIRFYNYPSQLTQLFLVSLPNFFSSHIKMASSLVE